MVPDIRQSAHTTRDKPRGRKLYCTACDYEIWGLPSPGKCPECGKQFDFTDACTYHIGKQRRFRFWFFAVVVVGWLYPAATIGLLYLDWCIAWITLGRQPQPWVDDPSDISTLVDLMNLVVMLAMLGLPIALLFGMVVQCGYGVLRKWKATSTTLMVTGFCIYGMIYLLFIRADPIRVMDWFMD